MNDSADYTPQSQPEMVDVFEMFIYSSQNRNCLSCCLTTENTYAIACSKGIILNEDDFLKFVDELTARASFIRTTNDRESRRKEKPDYDNPVDDFHCSNYTPYYLGHDIDLDPNSNV